jgi:hypothetical protein
MTACDQRSLGALVTEGWVTARCSFTTRTKQRRQTTRKDVQMRRWKRTVTEERPRRAMSTLCKNMAACPALIRSQAPGGQLPVILDLISPQSAPVLHRYWAFFRPSYRLQHGRAKPADVLFPAVNSRFPGASGGVELGSPHSMQHAMSIRYEIIMQGSFLTKLEQEAQGCRSSGMVSYE